MPKRDILRKYSRQPGGGTKPRAIRTAVPRHTHSVFPSLRINSPKSDAPFVVQHKEDVGAGDTLRAAIIRLITRATETLVGTVAEALYAVTSYTGAYQSTGVDLAGVHGHLEITGGSAELYNSGGGKAAGLVGTVEVASPETVEGVAGIIAHATVTDGSLDAVHGVRVLAPTLTAATTQYYYGLYIDGPATNATTGYAILTEAGGIQFNSSSNADADVTMLSDTQTMFFLDAGNETVSIGDTGGSDYSEFESDGTLTFNGAATVWDDLQVNISSVRLPTSSMPSWNVYKGSQVLTFSKDADEIIYFTAQLPHSYKEGSDIEFHIHTVYPDSNAGGVRWNFTHSWANMGDDFPAATTVSTTIEASGDADAHTLDEIAATITGTGKTISSVILCSLEREGTYAGGDPDDYNNNVYLVALDFHFEKDTVGSRLEASK